MESVHDNDRTNVFNVVYKSGEHSNDCGSDKQEWRVNLDLAYQSSRGFVFPDYVEVRFEASECEDKRDEKACRADNPEFSNGNVLCIFNNVHDLLSRPVQIEHFDDDGEVVRNKITESDRKRDGGEHDEQGDNGH